MISNLLLDRHSFFRPWCYMDDCFDKSQLNNLSEYVANNGEYKEGTVYNSEENFELNKVRRSNIKFFNYKPDTFWIFNVFNNVIENLNNRFYGFDFHGYNFFQYAEYNSENLGKYEWHMDMGFDNTDVPRHEHTRKLSLVMLLNEQGVDFEGGDFLINLSTENKIDKLPLIPGRIVAMPSFILHKVTPVTKGIRKSIVVWVTGPNFK